MCGSPSPPPSLLMSLWYQTCCMYPPCRIVISRRKLLSGVEAAIFMFYFWIYTWRSIYMYVFIADVRCYFPDKTFPDSVYILG